MLIRTPFISAATRQQRCHVIIDDDDDDTTLDCEVASGAGFAAAEDDDVASDADVASAAGFAPLFGVCVEWFDATRRCE